MQKNTCRDLNYANRVLCLGGILDTFLAFWITLRLEIGWIPGGAQWLLYKCTKHGNFPPRRTQSKPHNVCVNKWENAQIHLLTLLKGTD